MISNTSPSWRTSIFLLAVLLFAVNTVAEQTAFYKSVSDANLPRSDRAQNSQKSHCLFDLYFPRRTCCIRVFGVLCIANC